MKLDSLTQLFRKDLFEEMAYTKRNDEHYISIVYIDLDNFKGVNDNFGYYIGMSLGISDFSKDSSEDLLTLIQTIDAKLYEGIN